jgi:hypothetical protein
MGTGGKIAFLGPNSLKFTTAPAHPFFPTAVQALARRPRSGR